MARRVLHGRACAVRESGRGRPRPGRLDVEDCVLPAVVVTRIGPVGGGLSRRSRLEIRIGGSWRVSDGQGWRAGRWILGSAATLGELRMLVCDRPGFDQLARFQRCGTGLRRDSQVHRAILNGKEGWRRHSDLNRGPAVYEVDWPKRCRPSVEPRA